MKEPGPEHRAYTRTAIVTRLRDADNFSYFDACRGADAIEELEAENDALRAKLESLQRDLAARDATIAEMRERVKDYEDDYAAVVDAPCAPDEKHCTCVPILRRRIKELTAAEAKRFDLACAWRDTAEHIKAENDALRAKLEAAEMHKAAAPLCEKHAPNGGARSGCLVCSGMRLSGALSEIDYICGEPNEYELSQYDADFDEARVVDCVKALRAKLEAMSAKRQAKREQRKV